MPAPSFIIRNLAYADARLWLHQPRSLRSGALWIHARILRVLLAIAQLRSHALLIAAVVILSGVFIPWNVDEFIHYSPLLCIGHPFNALNRFVAGCGAYDLSVLGTGVTLPLRSYLYTGSLPALLYFPLFLLWPYPLSARLLGMLLLLVQAGSLARFMRSTSWNTLLLLVLFVPYAFQHLVDTGPIGVQTTSIILLAMLARSWMKHPTFATTITLVLLIFAGIWTKLIYAALLPGIAMLFLSAFLPCSPWRWKRSRLLQLLSHAMIALFMLAGITAVFLLSSDPSNSQSHPLLQELAQKGGAVPLPLFLRDFLELPTLRLLLNPFGTTHRIFVPFSIPWFSTLYGMLAFGLPIATTLALYFFRPRQRLQLLEPLLLYGAFLVTVFLLARLSMAWAMHHIVLAVPFLILSVASLWRIVRKSFYEKCHPEEPAKLVLSLTKGASRRPAPSLSSEGAGLLSVTRRASRRGERHAIRFVFALWLSINLAVLALFPLQVVRASDDRSKQTVHAVLNDPRLSGRYFTVLVGWGMYFYQSLYGPADQSVLYFRELRDPGQIEELQQMSREHGRKLLFVLLHSNDSPVVDVPLLERTLDLRPCVLTEGMRWHILLEEDTEPNPCLIPSPSGGEPVLSLTKEQGRGV